MARPYFVVLALVACAHRNRPVLEQPVGETHTQAAEIRTPTEEERPPDGRIDVCDGGHDGSTVHYELRGGLTRVWVASPDENPKLDVVMDRKSGLATLLINDRRQYALLDLDTMGAHAAGNLTGAVVQRTGQRRNVGGVPCEVWRIADVKHTVQVCVAKGGPPFDLGKVESVLGYEAPGWIRAVVAEGGVPMRVEMMDDTGPTCVTEMLPRLKSEIRVPADFDRIAP
jgi:hypothetical protein